MSHKSRKIMVIGGSGFVGRHLIRQRVAEGGWDIVSVDIQDPKEILDGVEYITHDVRNLSDLKSFGDVEIIFNFAAVHVTPGHPFWEYYDTNVRGATEIAKYARINGVNNIIFTSSISVYGPNEDLKDETSDPEPNSAYGWSKLLAEGVFREWNLANASSKLMIVRPAVVFGVGEGGNFTRLAKLLSKGVFVYPGRRNTVKSCVYVKDLIYYIDEMWKRDFRFIIFNGCYRDRYSLQDVVAELSKYFPKVREFCIPTPPMMFAARMMALLPNGIGIHPERITKLVKSTNIYPKSLSDLGIMKDNPLPAALKDWFEESRGKFV